MNSETAKKYLESLLKQALQDLNLVAETIQISTPEVSLGDLSTNLAMVLAKQVKKNPLDFANELVEVVLKLDSQNKNALEKAENVRGFINFSFKKEFLVETLNKILEQRDLYGCSLVGQGKKVVFEYSSPNTNKPLHIGHTRNDAYGVACINLLKALGYKVVSCEIINDRGIHIMKSILMYQKFGAEKTPESENLKPDHFVGNFYKMFAQESAKSEQAEKQLLEEAQELLLKWEAGDQQVREVWQKMNNWFFQGVKQTYESEGSNFDEVDYESQIFDKGREVVLEGVKKGVFQKEEDGSVSVDLTSKGLDKKYLLRKDGTTLYITQDMYLWSLREQRHHPDLAICITSSEQVYHFKVLGLIFQLLEFPWAKNFKHLPYEHVFLGSGKMSSREGNTITADGLLSSVKERIKQTMENSEKAKASVTNEKVIEQVAFGAIKYGYLKYEPNTIMYFDLEQTISVEGNTGPYIQYAYARISSILKQVQNFSELNLKQIPEISLQERNLLASLIHFPEVVELAATQYKPNLICNYLYETAVAFNRVYQTSPVLKETNEQQKNFRLNLISATAQVLKNGLNLLGIEAPEEM